MKRATSSFVFIAFMMCLPIYGQVTRGSLSGLVKDNTGASVAGANITAKHVNTGEDFSTTTDQQGAYVFPSVPLGKFTIKVEAAGFKRVEIQDIVVEVSIPAKVSVSLELGQIAESVVVSGDAQAVINTSSPTLTNVINTRQVKDLPLPNRDPLSLARLQAGIAVTGDSTRTASVGGLRGSATNVTQDGINAMDNLVKTDSFFAVTAPSLNSTSEFSVTVGTVGSDAGRGVAQVRMVTKSGSNDIHGGVFWMHRNDNLNANTFFNNATNVDKQIQIQNYFGGNVGGPVWLPKIYNGRDRSFWFFSYEGFREPSSTTRNRVVLTPEARQGIFRFNLPNGGIQSVPLLGIGSFNTLNPITTAQLNAMPLPNNTLIGDGLNTQGFRYNAKGSSPNDRWAGRFDQQLVENSRLGAHKLEFVATHAKFLSAPDTLNNNESPFPGGIQGIQSSTRTLLTAAIQSTFGSRFTNEVRVGHQRGPVGFLREAPPPNPFFIQYPGTANLDQVTNFELTFMSQGRNTMLYEYIDNFSMVSGSHTFRAGVDVQSITSLNFNDTGLNQIINIGTNPNNQDGILDAEFENLPRDANGNITAEGRAIANRGRNIYRDLVGLLGTTNRTFNITSPTSGFVPGATRQRDFKQREVSLYFQDQWRARRNFTLNYGVRWEWQGVPYEMNGIAIQPVDGLAGLFGISGMNNLFNPGVLQGQPTTALDFVNGDTGKKLYGNDWNNFAPFIGIAYSPNFDRGPMRWLFGEEGKSSIRAGYSISYLHDGLTVVSNALGTGTTNPGLIQTAANNTPSGVLTSAGISLDTPTFTMPITDAQNFAVNNTNGLWTFDPNLRVPYVQQWSLGIEREVANNTAIEFRYVGNHAVKVFRGIDFNEVNIFENGFLQEFLNAQTNLAINGGSTFAPGAAGTLALPTFTTLFAGLRPDQGFTNSAFINNLTNNNVGGMAFTLANNPTFVNTRKNLAPNFFLANPNASFARALINGSYSNYHSFQAEVRRRLSRGLQLQANYTLSKAITDSEGSQSTLEQYRTLRDFRLDRHRATFDQTHRVIANFLYELPFGTGRRWLNSGFSPLRKVVEGWQLGGIVAWQTGPPISIFSNRSTYNQFNAGLNPAQLVGMSFDEFKENVGVYKTPQGVFFFNPDLLDITTSSTTGRLTGAKFKEGIFDAPAPGTLGNFPRTQINGPNFSQTDFSLTKRTRFTEKSDFEFRVTFYNAFNQANFNFTNVNFDDALVNISNTRGSSRIIHFLLGINF
jgi:hypothetical protein